jgi:O-antigen biosynthesis protein
VGAADESLRTESGRLWEIDYCARAQQAGVRSVWACAAYVQRAPRGAPRGMRMVEPRASKPIPILRSEPRIEPKSTVLTRTIVSSPRQPLVEDRPRVKSEPPLISCIMPTRDRPRFVRQAIAYFLRQDYPCRELIVLDDSIIDGTLAELTASDPRIQLVPVPRGMSIGAKRNRGAELARGSIIAQWDDDDWYSPRRLSEQAAPLLAGEADITALDAGVWFDLERWEFWKASDSLHRRLFVGDVHGGTLVFRREVWQKLSKYPDRSIAEDAMFLRGAQSRGARLRRMNNTGTFVYVRHGSNSWSVAAGRQMGAGTTRWHRVTEPDFPPQDRAFYASLTSAAIDRTACPTDLSARPPSEATEPKRTIGGTSSADLPLVSCIMPTADRRGFVRRALHYFSRQDYENRELIIVDDGVDSVADLVPASDPRVLYVDARRSGGTRRSIGTKRNLACAAANGQIILHWDDDDWYSPRRISCQVACLLGGVVDQFKRVSRPGVCGLDRINYYDLDMDLAWQYVYRGRRPWVGGNTLAYRKSLWQAQPFANVNVGEDARFLWTGPAKHIGVLSCDDIVVGIIHHGVNGNVCPKRPEHSLNAVWRRQSLDEIRRLLGPDWLTFAMQGRVPDRPGELQADR